MRVVDHVEHLAGDQMYIDYTSDKLEIMDAMTGEVRYVEAFVAILPCSHYTYCEAVWSQKKEDLIVACENALHFFGSAPMAIVPDNLKSAVTRSDRNEPVINEDFAVMAEFYDMAVFPARARHPKDKALVENAVKRETILKTVWGNDSYANSLALNVQITYIRKALASDPTIAIVSLKKRGIVMDVK